MADDEPRFALTQADRQSQVWLKLAEHLEQKLKNLRGKNDGEDLDQIQTAHIRGQIKLAKGLLDLGKDEPPFDG